jgi:chaperonin GroES
LLRAPYQLKDRASVRLSFGQKDRPASIPSDGMNSPEPPKARITQPWSISMKFRPLHDRVVVERINAEAKSAGGIIIPDSAQEKPSQGEVIAIGPGGRDESGKLIPIDLKVGDRVLFGKWSGTEVKLDSVNYLIMKESDIMGVIEETMAKKMAA